MFIFLKLCSFLSLVFYLSSLIGLELRKVRAALAEGLYSAFEAGAWGAPMKYEKRALWILF